jgi:4'-phosphopantetheinyl transferase
MWLSYSKVDAVEVVATRLDAAPEAVGELHGLLSDQEKRRASRMALGRDRRRFIVARGRLRQLLGARLGVRPESVELVYGAHGKPALAPRFADADLRFNVSHCDDVAAYVLAFGGGRGGREIGIDIEAVRVMNDADDLAARFFSDGERAAYRALEPPERPLGFFNCWTRKEAFIKALGDGLGYPLDRFDVSLTPGEEARILRVGHVSGNGCGWRMLTFSPAPGFVGAVVTESKS